MTVDDDPRLFYYKLDCFVRDLPNTALIRIGQQLMTTMPCRDWRAIGEQLGYTMVEMDNFERRQIPGYDLLRDWSTRKGSTIRVLRSKLQQIERHDIVRDLENIRQNPITLDVVIHDSEPPFNTESGYSRTPEIKGRKELWDGLLFLLKEHVTAVTSHRGYTFFNLREQSWQNQCDDYRGEQLDIDVRHQDTMPTDFVRGFCATEVEPSWCLMSATQLRYSRKDCTVQTGSTSSDGAKVIQNSASSKPEAEATRTRRQESRVGWESGKGNKNSQSEGNKHPTQESARDANAAGSLVLKQHVPFSCKKGTNTVQSSGCLHGNRDLSTQETLGLALETLNITDALESKKRSMNLDLRSCEGPSGPVELSHPENTKKKRIHFNLQSEERSSRIHETDMAPRSETSTISLRSDSSLSDNCMTDVRDQKTYSPAVVAMAPSSPAAGPGEDSGREPTELRQSDLLLENENFVSEGFVKEETKDQQSCSLQRRHVYFLPKSEMIRSQCPGLWDLPGFHPKLKHKVSLISEVMKPYEKTDGWYLVRAYLWDENIVQVHLALTVTHKGKLKHFSILQHGVSNTRRYFLFNHDYEARSISELIDHYKVYPLIPGSLLVSGTNLPKLINPIPRDSFNYM